MALTLVGSAEYGDKVHSCYNPISAALGRIAAAAASQGLCGDNRIWLSC